MVDSRLARTMKDLSGFDYVIEYLPGQQNTVADLMSRLPGNDNGRVNETLKAKFLPKRLKIGKECQEWGGGDSMFETVMYGVRDLIC